MLAKNLTDEEMKKVGIIGLGLIGGSLGMALKENGYEVLGVDNCSKTLSYALDRGIIDEKGTISDLKGCQIVFLCVPLNKIAQIADEVYSVVGDDAIITDVASVKGVLTNAKGRVVGGHPMAGTEKSGITAAKAHLFENAFYAIVPYKNTRETDLNTITELVKSIKAKPIVMSATSHDERVSKISHLPHLIAYSLVNSVPLDDGFVGTGFMDSTRIASSDADFWTSVAFLNRENLLSDLTTFSDELEKVKDALERGERENLRALLDKARVKREKLTYNRVYLSEYTLDVDVRDEVGSIHKISKLLADNGINISGIQIINSREGVGGALRISVQAEKDYEKALRLLGLKDER